MAAIGNILSYFGFVGTWMYQINSPPEWQEKNLFVIFTHLFIGYFVVMDGFSLPVSLVIIVKELSMEFFQFLKRNAGSKNDNVSLGLIDFFYFFTTGIFNLNPFLLLGALIKFFTQPID